MRRRARGGDERGVAAGGHVDAAGECAHAGDEYGELRGRERELEQRAVGVRPAEFTEIGPERIGGGGGENFPRKTRENLGREDRERALRAGETNGDRIGGGEQIEGVDLPAGAGGGVEQRGGGGGVGDGQAQGER